MLERGETCAVTARFPNEGDTLQEGRVADALVAVAGERLPTVV
jgi:hypothetical protein